MEDKYEALVMGARDMENKFTFWFEKIKDCGIAVPKTRVFDIPTSLLNAAWMDRSVYSKWFEAKVMPFLKEDGLNGKVFVKNGVFSNKFDAKSCICYAWDIPRSIAEINEAAAEMFFGYAGDDELVVREYIPADTRKTPCIYNGLPLRPEFRVFYDFDTHEVLYVCNYWEYGYVRPHLFNATDIIVFDHEAEYMALVFEEKRDIVAKMVEDAMKNVHGLTGPWSIDILYAENDPEFARFIKDSRPEYWLIDMAVAEQSAFWEFHTERIMGEM